MGSYEGIEEIEDEEREEEGNVEIHGERWRTDSLVVVVVDAVVVAQKGQAVVDQLALGSWKEKRENEINQESQPMGHKTGLGGARRQVMQKFRFHSDTRHHVHGAYGSAPTGRECRVPRLGNGRSTQRAGCGPKGGDPTYRNWGYLEK